MNRVNSLAVATVILTCGTAWAEVPRGVNLAAMAGWDIVTAADAIPGEVYAAEEFRDFLVQATGTRLEIVQKAGSDGQHVFIGESAPMRASVAGFSTEGFGPEDLRIVVRENSIAIAGGRPRGTLYGVYTFLEDYAGVRFLTADHTYVPSIKGWWVVPPVDRFYHPPLSFRWSFYGESAASAPFAARIRCNTTVEEAKYGGKTSTALIGHTFGHHIPVKKYGQEHPEYFALVDGKRLNDVEHDWHQSQPCLTHPDVQRIVTEAVLEELKKNPHRDNIAVGQNDDDKYCRCPNCAAVDEREGTPMGSLLTLVNAVADEVAKQYPGVRVGTLSYWHTRKPPKTMKPRPNVQIQLCSIECCQFHAIDDPGCSKNVDFCRDMDNWGKICSDISVWNYNTNFSNYLLPCPNLRIIEHNVRYFVAHNAKGIFMQAAGNSMNAELADLRNYLMANLLWDPNRNGQLLVDEFLSLHYGKAAPPIRQFINTVHDQALASGKHPVCFGTAAEWGLTEELGVVGLQAFADAMRLADDDVVRARVEKASICAYRLAIDPVYSLAFQEEAKLDPALGERMRPLVKEFFELCDRHKVPKVAEVVDTPVAIAKLKRLYGLTDTQSF